MFEIVLGHRRRAAHKLRTKVKKTSVDALGSMARTVKVGAVWSTPIPYNKHTVSDVGWGHFLMAWTVPSAPRAKKAMISAAA